MGKIVPIRFVDRWGHPARSITGHPSDAAPIMDAVLRFETECPPPVRQDNEVPVVALVDTGADFSACTPELLASIGAPPLQPISLATASSSFVTMRHGCHLYFPSITLCLEIDIHASLLQRQGRFDMLIGRGALRAGKLVMDYPGQQFYWELP